MQAPQLDVSQPQWVPVKPGVSRMKWTSSRRGSMSRLTSSPLMLIVTCMFSLGLLAQRASGRAAQRAFGEPPDEGALVVARPATVRHRHRVLSGELARLFEQLLGRRL